jgi:hypothetical protein
MTLFAGFLISIVVGWATWRRRRTCLLCAVS